MREDVEIGDDDVSKKLVEEFESNSGEELIVTVLTWTSESKIIEFKKSQQQ